jgi:hypothetical protein
VLFRAALSRRGGKNQRASYSKIRDKLIGVPTNSASQRFGCRTRRGAGLISTTPLAFELVCKGTVLKTLGDAVRLYGELTPEQREEYFWRVAIHTLNSAIKEPRYLTAATITLQTALNLSGMLAERSAD